MSEYDRGDTPRSFAERTIASPQRMLGMLLRDDRELENGFLARAVGGDDADDL